MSEAAAGKLGRLLRVEKPPAPALDLAELLALVPVRNRAVRESRHERTLILYTPIRKRWWMGPPLSWLPGVYFRDEKGVALDRLGEEVWQACDGERTVEQIVDVFAARHKLRFHEARLSVMAFLKMLMQRSLIVLVAPRDEAPGPSEGTQEHGKGRKA